MREKPVPVRVGKDLQPSETLMDVTKEEINFEKETCENASEDTISKELPSMVSVISEVIPLNSTNESPSKYATRLYQTATEYRPSLDIPGEFEFLNSASVSESQKQAVKFGVRVFRGTFIARFLLLLNVVMWFKYKYEPAKASKGALQIYELKNSHFLTLYKSFLEVYFSTLKICFRRWEDTSSCDKMFVSIFRLLLRSLSGLHENIIIIIPAMYILGSNGWAFNINIVGLLYQFCAWRENILYCNIF